MHITYLSQAGHSAISALTVQYPRLIFLLSTVVASSTVMLPFWVDWDYSQGCSYPGSLCNAKSPYTYKTSTARTNAK